MKDLQSLPKVVLHDHLDGGLRPGTILDLAQSIGYQGLPAADEESLSRWFYQGEARSLEAYLGAFGHTAGVMQTPEAMHRAAFEALADHAASGVVYAELRFAPSLHTKLGMRMDEAIAGVLAGLEDGAEAFGVSSGLIVDALRHNDDSVEVAQVAAGFAGRGVVAFDLAGPEAGFPPSGFAEACALAASGGLHLTIHAGEGAGVTSIAEALEVGAERIGHGVRIIEDTASVAGRVASLGPVATRVFEQRIPLEICPTSNLHTGMYPSAAAHPLGALHRAGFAVTLNTDNRLMSGVTITDEFGFAVEHQGFGRDDLRAVTLGAVEAAFCSEAERAAIRERVLAGFG